jgi:FtsP/CotA-like multicopper oxidase with cupredoxin domain
LATISHPRRWLVTACLVGLALLSLPACDDDSSSSSGGSDEFEPRQEFAEPDVRESEDGVLETTLTAKEQTTTVAGREVTGMVYEGSFPGPTLRVKPGDQLKIHLNNDLDETTNLHLHGMHVSPRTPQDDVLIHIGAGESYDFDFEIPDDQTPGTYWYHPHGHTNSNQQIYSGMAGALIVEGGLDEVDGVAGVPEKVMVLQSTAFRDGRADFNAFSEAQNFVNGQLTPRITMRPGEVQRWRFIDAAADTFYSYQMDGVAMHTIAVDGNPLASPLVQTIGFGGNPEPFAPGLPYKGIPSYPGARQDVLVQPKKPGTYRLYSGEQGFPTNKQETLVVLKVEGDLVQPRPEIPSKLIPFDDLNDEQPVNNRTITFNHTGGANGTYFIDGQTFDANRIAEMVEVGTVEDWTIVNADTGSSGNDFHVFHIHTNPFQLMEINGQPVEAYSFQDTIQLTPGYAYTVRMKFIDFTGKPVFHCHIALHQDHGMMSVFEIGKN